MDSFFLLRLQRASLFLHPYPRRCLGLYSCWGFALPLLVTSTAQCLGLCSCYGFVPPLPIIFAVEQCHVAGIIFNRVHCISTNTDDCILASTDYSISAKTGWKPKKNIAQSNALGTVDHLFCALKEQKEGECVPTVNNFVDIWVCVLFSFCAYSAPVCLYIFTQGVALGCIPIGASPRPCSNVNSQNYLQVRPVFARNVGCCTMFWLCAVAHSGRNLYADCLLWFRLSNLLNTGLSNLL